MHFYTYDEWLAKSYYSTDTTQIESGGTRILDLTSLYEEYSDAKTVCLHVRSCWKQPKFLSTFSVSYPSIVPNVPELKCDFGCLYQMRNKDEVPDDPYKNYMYSDSDPEGYRKNRGCIQALDGQWGIIKENGFYFMNEFPYIMLMYGEDIVTHEQHIMTYHDNFTEENKNLITILLKGVIPGQVNTSIDYTTRYNRILLFQAIYGGAISFPQMTSSLEFNISHSPSIESFDDPEHSACLYRMPTNFESNDSLMIASAMLTFTSTGKSRYLTIENISKFVYGHVDMDAKFNWNDLWKNYQVKE